MAKDLYTKLAQNTVATNANNAYALGVAFYLIGNLLRAGGRYNTATTVISAPEWFIDRQYCLIKLSSHIATTRSQSAGP